MKKYLTLLAMLLFRIVAAQTIAQHATVYRQNGTVELHTAIRTVDSTILKTLKYNEVSRADVDNYLDSGITVAGKAETFSLFHGAMVREKVVLEKNNNLHYGITYLNGNFSTWIIGVLMVICCMTTSTAYAIAFKKKPFWILLAPIATGLLFSVGTDIGYSSYHLNWDEKISYAILGIVFGAIVFFFKQIMPLIKSYWLRKMLLLGRK